MTDLAAAKALGIRGAFFDFIDDMVGDERAVAETWVMGKSLYGKGSPA